MLISEYTDGFLIDCLAERASLTTRMNGCLWNRKTWSLWLVNTHDEPHKIHREHHH